MKTAERMRKSRARRADNISLVTDKMVRAIAKALDLMKDKHKYVIVHDVVEDWVVRSVIKLEGKKEPITFSDPLAETHLRSMQEVDSPERYVPQLFSAFKLAFPLCKTRKLKLLTSEAGDVAQMTHTDYVPPVSEVSIDDMREFHYSAVIAIEDNTRLLVGIRRKITDIPLHVMIFFRGDMLHAGAGYSIANSRLFFSISSPPFPATMDVFLHN